jgi:hypothetical protein
MKYSAIFTFLLFFLVGCVKPDVQSVYNLTFKKRYDLNQNKVLEEDEYKKILIREYKTLKFFKKLPTKHMNVDQYVESEFLAHDLDNDKVITWDEIIDYGSKQYFLGLDLNNNGFLELNDEFKLDISKEAYMESVKQNLPVFKNSQNEFLSFEDYKLKVKTLINPNNDDKIELKEYMNYLKNYCECKNVKR